MIAILRRTVVVALLAAWSFPATGLARTQNATDDATAARAAPARGLTEATESSAPGVTTPSATAPASGSPSYAEREKQSRGLEDFQGKEGYIYIGGGALTVVLIVVLLLLIL
jgi:hypothetical protein